MNCTHGVTYSTKRFEKNKFGLSIHLVVSRFFWNSYSDHLLYERACCMRSLNEVREALLNRTVRIVSQYVLERTTTKLIAADAQINEAYIYRCYDSKDSLLQATFHMEDVCLAEHVRKSLPVMRIRGLNWKERCFLLWKSCWEFILHKPDDCRFYLQYYYSASC